MNGIASILERKLGLERDFCAKGSSRSEPLQAKLVADITAVPVPAVILRQVQMHLEVPHLGHSIKIGEQSSDNLLSCQVSAACAKPLRTFVVMCQSHKAGQVRKMTGTSVTSSISRSHHCLSWGCLLDGAVFITSWRCVAKWTAGVRGPSEPLVGSTKCKHSVPSFRTKRLRRDVDMLTLCVKPLSAVHHTTEATHAFVSNMQLQEAGQVRVMPGTCVTSSIFRGRDFGTWRCPVDAAICNTSHSCLWRLLGNWTACVRLLSHLRLQPLVGSTRYKRSVPPVGSEGFGGHLWTFCAKPLNVHHTTIATHAFVSNRQLQETGQMRKMTGTRLTSCIFRPRGFETLPCPVDIAICSTSHSCLWLLSGNWTACVGRLSHLRLQLLVESTRVWDRKPASRRTRCQSMCQAVQHDEPRLDIFFNRIMAQACDRHQSGTGSWTSWGDAGDEPDFFYLSQPSLSELGMSPGRRRLHHILALCCKMDCLDIFFCSLSFTRRSSSWLRKVVTRRTNRIMAQAVRRDRHPHLCLDLFQSVAASRTSAKDAGEKPDFFYLLQP